MTKKERAALCSLIANWEWRDHGGTATGGMAYAACISDLKDAFKITDDELKFDRAWEMCKVLGLDPMPYVQPMCDWINTHGLEDAITRVDSRKHYVKDTELREYLLANRDDD